MHRNGARGRFPDSPERSRIVVVHIGKRRRYLHVRSPYFGLELHEAGHLSDSSANHHSSESRHEVRVNRAAFRTHHRRRKGTALVEFALVGFLLVLVLLASIEFSRMLLVYTAVANAARAGCRYAITHGTDNPTTVTAIQTVVSNFAGTAPINATKLTTTVSPNPYSGAGTAPGSTVYVQVVYAYDPFTILPLHVNLGSISYGVV